MEGEVQHHGRAFRLNVTSNWIQKARHSPPRSRDQPETNPEASAKGRAVLYLRLPLEDGPTTLSPHSTRCRYLGVELGVATSPFISFTRLACSLLAVTCIFT